MKRTQIYLTEEEHEQLDRLAEQTGKTKSWLIREAVEAYVVKKKPGADRQAFVKAGEDVFGIWKDRSDADIKELRAGADREANW